MKKFFKYFFVFVFGFVIGLEARTNPKIVNLPTWQIHIFAVAAVIAVVAFFVGIYVARKGDD